MQGLYLQYRAELSSSNSYVTPVLKDMSLRYTTGTVGEPAKLGFIFQPAGAIAGSAFATQPTIAVQDAAGYTIITDNSTQVTLAIENNPSGGVLACTENPKTVINGMVSFSGCMIDKAGTGYTLVASAGSLTSATSGSFDVVPVAPASITLGLSPETIAANGTSTSLATATVLDAGSHLLSGETVSFSTNGDVTIGAVTDQGNGTYTAIVTASRSPGDETISATVRLLSASNILHETISCPAACFRDTTTSDFSNGAPGTTTYLAQTSDGEVTLVPTVGAEFATLPASGWSVMSYGSGQTDVTVSGSSLHVGSARYLTDALYGPGRVLEFAAIFTSSANQAAGLGYSFQAPPLWAAFDTDGIDLYAHTNSTQTLIAGSWLGTQHIYRIEWTSSNINYFIDGDFKLTHAIAITNDMRPIFGDTTIDSNLLHVDWVRMSPYTTPGTFLSRVYDASGPVDWGTASWTAGTPSGTSVAINVRSGTTATPDEGTWTAFSPITNGSSLGVTARYLQYQVVLTTSNPDLVPTLQDICISYEDHIAPTIISRSPAPGATGVSTNTSISIGFSEPMLASTISTSSIRLRASGAPSDVPATVSYAAMTATLTPAAALIPNIQYEVTVAASVSDLAGNPLGSADTWAFTTINAGSFTDTTVADFTAGTPGTSTYIAQMSDGEVILQPTIGTEFSGTSLPSGWVSTVGTGTVSVGGGMLTLSGPNSSPSGTPRAFNETAYGPGRSIEFKATMDGTQYQAIGFAQTDGGCPCAVFDFIDGATRLDAYTSGTNTAIGSAGAWTGQAHIFRIDWTASSINYYIDGVLRVTHNVSIPGTMHPFIKFGTQNIDWVHMSPYPASGIFTSRVIDAGQLVDWTTLTSTATTPAGTSIGFEARIGNSPIPDATWTSWQAANGTLTNPGSQYIQYRATLATTDANQTPSLEQVTISYSSRDVASPLLPSELTDQLGQQLQLDRDQPGHMVPGGSVYPWRHAGVPAVVHGRTGRLLGRHGLCNQDG